MKRKLIACLLSVTMLCSLFPTFALATSADEEPTGTLSVICPVCEAENCTEHIPCDTCGGYDCNGEHSVMPLSDPEPCTTCGQAECICDKNVTTCEQCGKAIEECECEPEVTTCEKCSKAIEECECEPEVDTCETCGNENCTSDHTNWCETCKKDDCGIDHNAPQPCDTCSKTDCTSEHTNWCEICKMDDCGKTHVFCETCQIYDCGNAEHAVMPADEDGDGEGVVTPGDTEGDPEPELSFYEQLTTAETFEVLYGLMTDTSNSSEMAALTYDQLNTVNGNIDSLYELLEKKDADTEYQKKLLHGQIETLIAQNDTNFAALIDSCTCYANKSRLVIHATDCPAYIAPPDAVVTEIGTTVKGGYEFTSKVDPFDMNLTYAMQFATQESYTPYQEAYYGTWVADFVITTNKRITGADAYLAGQFDMFNDFHNDEENRWVKISMPTEEALEANQSLQLIPVVTGQTFPFLGVVEYIQKFNCGIWVSDTYLQQNPGFAVSVELRLYPSTDGRNYDSNDYITLTEINYQSTSATITYTAGEHGSVDKTTETVGTLIHPSGSTPTAAEGYHFDGWYYDAEYKNEVPSGWVGEGNKLIPGTNSSGTYDSATYYAKFAPDTVDLKFELSGGMSTSTYLFTLTGNGVSLKLAVKGGESITIQDLPAGEYTITPDNNWNWRETVSVTGSGNLTQDATAAVTVTGNGKKQWFNGYAYDKN